MTKLEKKYSNLREQHERLCNMLEFEREFLSEKEIGDLEIEIEALENDLWGLFDKIKATKSPLCS